MNAAMDLAEEKGLPVIFYGKTPGFGGADLKWLATQIRLSNFAGISELISQFQAMGHRLRYSPVRTFWVVMGNAIGGGLELPLQCDHIVAEDGALYWFAEALRGLIPAGGGCMETLKRTLSSLSPYAQDFDLIPLLKTVWQKIALAPQARGCYTAREFGYLRDSNTDFVVPLRGLEYGYLLQQAVDRAKTLTEIPYTPPTPYIFQLPMIGSPEFRALESEISKLKESGKFKGHSLFVAQKVAELVCGGTPVAYQAFHTEQDILDLERKIFLELCNMPETLAMIGY